MVDIVQERLQALSQVVRRHVAGHAHRDAGGAVDQQVGNARRQHQRLVQGLVVGGLKVDGVLVQIGQNFRGQLRHAHLRVAHGSRRVAVDRAEVALAVDEEMAHGELLRQPHDGVVDGRLAMGMILADHVAHHPCRLAVGAVVVIALLVHGEQHAPVHWLETVPDIGKGAPDDDAHRVLHVRLAHLVFDVDRRNRIQQCGIHPRSGCFVWCEGWCSCRLSWRTLRIRGIRAGRVERDTRALAGRLAAAGATPRRCSPACGPSHRLMWGLRPWLPAGLRGSSTSGYHNPRHAAIFLTCLQYSTKSMFFVSSLRQDNHGRRACTARRERRAQTGPLSPDFRRVPMPVYFQSSPCYTFLHSQNESHPHRLKSI